MTTPSPARHGPSTTTTRTGAAHRRRARRGERGTVLMLMPAAAIIMVLLGAIAVDSALVFMRQREAFNAATSAANDAAGAGFDLSRYRQTGEFVYDDERATALVTRSLEVAAVDGLSLVDVSAAPGGGVTVDVRIEIGRLFRPNPFGERTEVLDVSVTAIGVAQ